MAGKGKKRDNWLKRAATSVLHGKLISIGMLAKFSGPLLLLCIAILAVIATKFSNQRDLQTIKRLTAELRQTRTDCVVASAAYYSRVREAEMKHLVDSFGLDLHSPDKPPYKISDP